MGRALDEGAEGSGVQRGAEAGHSQTCQLLWGTIGHASGTVLSAAVRKACLAGKGGSLGTRDEVEVVRTGQRGSTGGRGRGSI